MISTEQTYISEAVTPSGIEIRYGVEPRRVYEVRQTFPYLQGIASDVPAIEWREVPSVTTVLDVLKKDGLHWWGQGVAVDGVLELLNRGELKPYDRQLTIDGVIAGKEQIVTALTKHKLTVNHVRDKAGSRGTAVHDAFELWAREGYFPRPQDFPEEERGYVHGLCAFLEDVSPEPLAAEVMVGSVKHGYAGRYDVRFRTTQDRAVVYKRTPRKGPQWANLKAGYFLGDLKTSAGTYLSHHMQLAAYEGASVECGYEPTEAQGIIHVSKDGTYEFVRSHGRLEDFLAVKNAADALNDLARRTRARKGAGDSGKD